MINSVSTVRNMKQDISGSTYGLKCLRVKCASCIYGFNKISRRDNYI